MKASDLKPGDRIAIVNRGESAMRFLNAVRDFNEEHRTNFKTIALYTKPDQHAKFVQRADVGVCLGGALEPDPSQRDEADLPIMKSPYLIYDRLAQALRATGANAVWVGWGFVAEHAEFADLCDEMGIVFIGPTGDTMRMLGDKIGSKHVAEKAGAPVSPWSKGAVKDVADARQWAEKIGYPLVVKATAGGGGRGIRKVLKAEDIESAFTSATTEAAKAFGDGSCFMEKMIVGARHLEVQVLADNYGAVWPVGVRDCSVQRRNQKVIEEAPAAILTPEQEQQLRTAAADIARTAKYRNAGTAEFLYADGEFYFMEMNTRLQVEHPVTELTTGIDMVKMQIRMAMGEKLEGEPPATVGHAIEVRLNAEDPYNQFAPSPGKIEIFNTPGGPGVRVDSGVETGSEIPSSFDSMIAKIMAVGRDRQEALARLRRALKDTLIVIENGATNKAFLIDLLNRREVVDNDVFTSWLDGLMAEGLNRADQGREVALIVAGIEIYTKTLHEKREEFFKTVSRGRPRKLPMAEPVEVEMRLDGGSHKLEINLLEQDRYRIHCEDDFFDVRFVRDGAFKARLYYDETKYEVSITPRQSDYEIEVEGASLLVEQDSGGVVKSNSPAIVLAVHVESGQIVTEGDPLVTLEAMKMEMLYQAPQSGRIGEIFVKKGGQIGPGDPILVIEAEGAGGASESDKPALAFKFGSLPEKQGDPNQQVIRECKSFMMGFDVHRFSFENMLDRIPAIVSELAKTESGRDTLATFLKSLCRMYFDIEFLFLKQVSVSETDISSPEQNFFIYLQLLRTGMSHPAEDFIDRLKNSLTYYDVEPYGPTDPLEEALIHVFHSHNHLDLKQRLLQRVFYAFEVSGAFSDHQGLKLVLEDILKEARKFYREIYDLAIDAYYHIFEKACFDETLEHASRSLDKYLEQLDRGKEKDRDQIITNICYVSQSLIKYFTNRFRSANLTQLKNYVEILLRRFHLEYRLKDLRTESEGDIVWCSASYQIDQSEIRNLSFAGNLDLIDEALGLARGLIDRTHGVQEIILDLYFNSIATLKEDEYAERLTKAFSDFPVPALLSRIRIVIGDDFPLARCFHFIPTRTGEWQENRLFRGISEMLAKRLYLERLKGFETRRLPTEENINLFYCVARENPEDQRLIAFNEVREAPPEREEGVDFYYPSLHREFLMIMKAMRHEQDKYAARGSFYWNQVIIYIRPVLPVGREEFLSYLRQIISGTQQVHLEKIRLYVLLAQPHGDVANEQVEVSFPGGMGLELRYAAPTTPDIEPLSKRDFRQALARRRKLNYPFETIRLLTDGYFYKGEFEEFDLVQGDEGDVQCASVKGRPEGENQCGIVFGVITNFTPIHPDGMSRVIILGDGNFGLGCLAEPECRRVNVALDLAESRNLPVEWIAISSGAKISMDNGTENLDWTAATLRRIIEFTEAGGELNIIVDGINVGAQSYWNAEATMLMHTKGCLIMTPRGCMVLTGKSALDYSGSVSAEDNVGIGGLQRIMGPNGQVHYPANDLLHAFRILFRFYAYTYVRPGDKMPRDFSVEDQDERNICEDAYKFDMTPDYTKIGDIFDEATNPGKKKPFDMRQVMHSVVDRGQKPLERWPLLLDGDTAIVWDTTIGGICCSVIGIQSYPIKRRSEAPNDGPDSWSGGTLFPQSSKKVARALNAASGSRPVVILANLSGFDGSPESLRKLQLEYGAEIGRSVVNFKGPIVFCVLSRYHGGAYVVFSTQLNKEMKAIALDGAFASVIGGAPAAAVVFVREVRKRTLKDPRVEDARELLDGAVGLERNQTQLRYQEIYEEVLREKQAEMAVEFDTVHSVQRARDVGSLDDIIAPDRLRPYIIDELRRRK